MKQISKRKKKVNGNVQRDQHCQCHGHKTVGMAVCEKIVRMAD